MHVFQLRIYLSSMRQAGGGANVNTMTLELNWSGRMVRDNSIIAEVAWVGGDALLVKEVTHAAEDGHVVYFDLAHESGRVGKPVRKLGKDGEHGDDRWIDAVRHCAPFCIVA